MPHWCDAEPAEHVGMHKLLSTTWPAKQFAYGKDAERMHYMTA